MAVCSARISGVCLVVLVITIFIGSSTADEPKEGNGTANKMYVKFVPNGQKDQGFYEMPRTVKDAKYAEYKFQNVGVNAKDKNTYVHCPDRDTRMCIVMDVNGNLVGVMVSMRDDEVDSNVPASSAFQNMPEVFLQELLGEKVHSCIMYFMPEAERLKGRTLTESTPTAPRGLFIWRESGELSIPLECSSLKALGFCKQGCYPAMGYHYTYNICPERTNCEDLMPFTILCGPKSDEVVGFVFYALGSQMKPGKWIEKYNEAGFKITTPNAQQCIYDYANRYNLNTIHFYLVKDPWSTLTC